MATKKRKANQSKNAAKESAEKNGEKVKITGRDIQITFVAFFFIFMGVGYMRGRAVRSSPERLKIYLGQNIRNNSGLLQFARDSSGRRRIRYMCPNKQYWYEVDADKIHQEPGNLAASSIGESFEPAIARDDVFFTTFVVGAISAWSVKDVFSYVGIAQRGGVIKSKLKVVIAAVLGTVIGYEVGYWIATRSTPECDSPAYDTLLSDPKEWKLLEKGVWEERVRNAEEGIGMLAGCQAKDASVQHTQNERMNEALTKIEELKDKTSEIGYDYSSTDFDLLDEFVKVKNEYVRMCSG
ncbi:MAG TPA: hypothetical protein VF544_12770 [Pyrinomonadaceae bacterium]|jgi:hypothetical protein